MWVLKKQKALHTTIQCQLLSWLHRHRAWLLRKLHKGRERQLLSMIGLFVLTKMCVFIHIHTISGYIYFRIFINMVVDSSESLSIISRIPIFSLCFELVLKLTFCLPAWRFHVWPGWTHWPSCSGLCTLLWTPLETDTAAPAVTERKMMTYYITLVY